MADWLVIWGVGQATWSISRPILEELAKDVANDAAKSYVGRCFRSVFSVIHRDPLTKATGLALKELLELIENELIRGDLEDDELRGWVQDVRRFVDNKDVRQAIASLFLIPGYHLDPRTFAQAWQQPKGGRRLPNDFSWQFVAKRFCAKVGEIRQQSAELRETFDSLAKLRDSSALQELAGLPPDFSLETYREALVERYANLDLASLDTTGPYYNNIRLWSIFVPQSVRECHEYDPQLLEVPKEDLQRLTAGGELDAEQLAESELLREERRRAYLSQPTRPVLRTTDDSAIQRLVVLGEPGSGKSSLLRFLALRWARTEDVNRRYTQPLPLLIELREYNRWECSSGKGFPRYLHEAPNWHRLNQQTLKHLLEQPDRVVLLLDGLDEVFDPVQREQVINDIHRFSNDYKNARILVTSRVVGYKPKRLRDAQFRHFMLQDLDREQIDHFLDQWHDVTFDKAEEGNAKRERLAKAIGDSQSIAQLAGNPLLLTMMAVLNRNQKLPDDRIDLYQQCSRLLLHQWDVERALDKFPGLSDEIGLPEKTDILRSVANAMQTRVSNQSRANYINGTTLTNLIEEHLRNELRFEQARAVSRALVEQLRTRNFVLCSLGADSYAFVHRTFLEYFCAAEIVYRFNVAKTLDEPALIALFDEHCGDDDWREVLRLICPQIDAQCVGRIVEHLAARVDLEKWDGLTPLPALPLAIGCLTEVRNASRVESAGVLTLSKVIECARRGVEQGSHTFLMDQLLPACREIGERWPGREMLAGFEGKILDGVQESGYGEQFWPYLMAFVLGSRNAVRWLAETHEGSEDGAVYRTSALDALAEKWPDQATRELFIQRAVQEDKDLRSKVLLALAEKWPDQATRDLLTQRAVQDGDQYTRGTVLGALAKKWPDEATRDLLTQRAVKDVGSQARRDALQALAEKWPDGATCELLAQRAVEDRHGLVRRDAFQVLAKKRPDGATCVLLAQRAVEDEHPHIRGVALRTLAQNWPTAATRAMLTQRAIQDARWSPRSSALQALADNWPDEATRELLTQRAAQDEDQNVRLEALQALAKTWPDVVTREMVTQRAVQDENEFGRRAFLQILAEKWPDEATRKLLTQRAVHDKSMYARQAALQALAEKWPGESHTERSPQ